MNAIIREYKEGDIERISKFYVNLFEKGIISNNLKCAWECFSKHPCFPDFRPEEFGIWEENGKIVGVVNLESPWNGTVLIDLDPFYWEIYGDMIDYAEKHFAGIDEMGKKYLNIITLKTSKLLHEALRSKKYIESPNDGVIAYSLCDSSILPQIMPKGFQIKSLDEVYNFDKLNTLLWKAFNYEGEPPAYYDNVNPLIKHAWLEYQRDICTVILAPDGSYAAFCGMWFDEDSFEVFLEPLATNEKYRNLGLGKACVYSSLKKCKEMGAKYVYVAPDNSSFGFYKNIGFKDKVREEIIWKKSL
jgi:N-acetylglutamate synthase-like GNAT family acetyltransferase